ncbi:MAG: MotA/TolQ/ExbB proton channel family protein [Desulfosalsimonadaceae bacterium]
MKNPSRTAFLIVLFLLLAFPASAVEDMREMQIEARQEKQALLEKARQEKQAAEKEAAEARKRILADRASLEEAIAALEKENQAHAAAIETLESDLAHISETEKTLDRKLDETDSVVRELVGAIRINAKDIRTLIDNSLQAAFDPAITAELGKIASKDVFPGMSDVRTMSDILLGEIRRSGSVRLENGIIVDRSGRETEAEILLIGNFTAAYRTDEEIGFLNHSTAGDRLFALSRLPSGRMQRRIADYMDGKSEAVPLDISRGGALRQLTHELRLWEQVPTGGPIVWPILILLGLGVVIIIERIVFLVRKRFDSESFMRQVNALVKEGRFEDCRRACEDYDKKPVARVVGAGLACCHMPREEMENALQEAILREIPPMERFLSTLGMLAAIAPLLGLLGTVTGMINTFHVITLYGTGDPRMMSGGISEALVTTMLGLSVAIPMLMAHTWLNRAVDKNIAEMEEKAVTLVNIAHKSREMNHNPHDHNHPA